MIIFFSKIHFGPPCVYTYEFQLSLWSNLLQENIEENLTKILSAHSLFATDDAHVAVEPLYIGKSNFENRESSDSVIECLT